MSRADRARAGSQHAESNATTVCGETSVSNAAPWLVQKLPAVVLSCAPMGGTRRKLRGGRLLARTLWRAVSPRHLLELIRRSRRQGRHEAPYDHGKMQQFLRGRELAAFDNPQLELYAKILPGGFLHYGYFDDVETSPTSMSLDSLEAAQRRYAERVLELVEDRCGPVLDVGAGMGGISRMLLERGVQPVALTPDRNQVRAIQQQLPEVEVIEGRFHEVGWARWESTFGTVITAESFQYLFLDNALTTIRRILRPGGRWVMCDYFRRSRSAPGSGHVWDEFVEAATGAGWTVLHDEDITAHVVPSLQFVRLLGDRFAVPLMAYLEARTRRNRPGLHYVLQELFAELRAGLDHRLEDVDPETFQRHRMYRLVVVAPPPDDAADAANNSE